MKLIYKALLTISCSLLIFNCSFGQAPVIEWQRCYGGSGMQEGFEVIRQTNDKGYILAGYTYSTDGDITFVPNGRTLWVIKLDSIGNIQWQKGLGGSQEENVYFLEITDDGGYIVAGSTMSDDGDVIGFHGPVIYPNTDSWIVKLDSIGNIQWQKCLGGSKREIAYSVKQISGGGYIIANFANSIDGDVIGIHDSLGALSGDAWIVRLDYFGNIIWQKCFGSWQYGESANSILQTSDGNYLFTGFTDCNPWPNNNGDILPHSGSNAIWIVKIDTLGNILWQHYFGELSMSNVFTQQTNDGGYIIAGHTYGSTLSLDFLIVKLDSSGNTQWQHTLGGTDGDAAKSIQQIADGGFIVAGNSFSNDLDVTGNHGNSDVWIMKLDSLGNIEWQKCFGGSNNESADCIIQTLDGDLIVSGSTSSHNGDVSGIHSNSPSIYGYDAWVMKLTDNYNSITGNLFYDQNNNSVQDNNESSIPNKKITDLISGRIAFPQSDGSYNLSVLDTGNFACSSTYLNYFSIIPGLNTSYFPAYHLTDSLNDFAYQASGVYEDLCITINALGRFRPGHPADYNISFENQGTTSVNGTVNFFPASSLTYISSSQQPTAITNDSIVWSTGILTPFQTGSFTVTVNVDSFTSAGTNIYSSVRIDPIIGDANTECNYNSWIVAVTGSYDPNEMLVDRSDITTTDLSNNSTYLNYIINFQNTGNDTAFNVRVLNNIPNNLDINSFEFVASSNPVSINYGAHARLMEFNFNNILLPDSNANESASHGFIRYKIKPLHTLNAGDTIGNKAFIYFDVNAPVETNSALTTIVIPTGVAEETAAVSSKLMSVFPNPTNNYFTVIAYGYNNSTLIVYDITGRILFQQSFNTKEKLNVSSLTSGVYLLEVKDKQGNSVKGKVLKE